VSAAKIDILIVMRCACQQADCRKYEKIQKIWKSGKARQPGLTEHFILLLRYAKIGKIISLCKSSSLKWVCKLREADWDFWAIAFNQALESCFRILSDTTALKQSPFLWLWSGLSLAHLCCWLPAVWIDALESVCSDFEKPCLGAWQGAAGSRACPHVILLSDRQHLLFWWSRTPCSRILSCPPSTGVLLWFHRFPLGSNAVIPICVMTDVIGQCFWKPASIFAKLLSFHSLEACFGQWAWRQSCSYLSLSSRNYLNSWRILVAQNFFWSVSEIKLQSEICGNRHAWGIQPYNQTPPVWFHAIFPYCFVLQVNRIWKWII
jgi:hypothetical protein